MQKRTADIVTDVLRGVVEHGTGTAARFDRPAAGKTGTTNSNTDAWFVGYTASPRLTTAVWMGYGREGTKSMDRVRGRPVNGGGIPAQIWQKFMRVATAGAPPGDFDPPPDLSEGNTLPQASGRDRTSALPSAGGEVSPSPSYPSGPAPTAGASTTLGSGGTTTTAKHPGGATTTTAKLPATTVTTRRLPSTTTPAPPTTKAKPAGGIGPGP